jgi:hypothetical protein
VARSAAQVLSAVKQFEKTGKKPRLFFAATLPTEPWGHWAGLKICCDFAQIVCSPVLITLDLERNDGEDGSSGSVCA